MNNPLKSRKFYAAVIGLLFVFFGERAGLTEEAVSSSVQILMAYILGQGLADIRKS